MFFYGMEDAQRLANDMFLAITQKFTGGTTRLDDAFRIRIDHKNNIATVLQQKVHPSIRDNKAYLFDIKRITTIV